MSLVGIVTFHEFVSFHSPNELCLFLLLRIEESNHVYVPIFPFCSLNYNTVVEFDSFLVFLLGLLFVASLWAFSLFLSVDISCFNFLGPWAI